MDEPRTPHPPRLRPRRLVGAAIDVAGVLLIGGQLVAWMAG